MRSPIRFVVCAAVASAFGFISCAPPTLSALPENGAIYGNPVAVQFQWSAFAPLSTDPGAFSASLDGQNITSQLQAHSALLNTEDGTLTLSPGTHTLSATALLFDDNTNTFTQTSASSTFTVAASQFAVAPMQTISVVPNTDIMATVTVTRSGYDGPILISPASPDFAVTMGTCTVNAGASSCMLDVNAGPGAQPGATDFVRVTATGVSDPLPPTQSAYVTVQIVDQTPPPTWTQIYNNYFGPGSPGHCNNCHASGLPHTLFAAGPDKDSFYNALISPPPSPPLVSTGANASTSRLIDANTSPLRWFNLNGPMPQDNAVANDTAANDIRRWVNAGALNDNTAGGSGGSGGSGGGSCQGDPCGVGQHCCGDILDDCSCTLCSPPNGECQ